MKRIDVYRFLILEHFNQRILEPNFLVFVLPDFFVAMYNSVARDLRDAIIDENALVMRAVANVTRGTRAQPYCKFEKYFNFRKGVKESVSSSESKNNTAAKVSKSLLFRSTKLLSAN